MLRKGSTRKGMSGGIVLGGISGETSRVNVQREMSGGKCARVFQDNRVGLLSM